MIDFATMGILKFWIGNVPNLDHPRLDIDDTAILIGLLPALELYLQQGTPLGCEAPKH